MSKRAFFDFSLFLGVFFVLSSPAVFGQSETVQWASRLFDFSSAYSNPEKPTQFGAAQLLGKPNKLPSVGSSPCAWSPASQNNPGGEWVKVGFEIPQKIRQVAVAESQNPGSIQKIYAYDTNQKAHLIYQNFNLSPLKEKGRMFRVFMSETPYRVQSLKIVLNTAAIPGWNHIDAIGISASVRPIEAQINEVAQDEIVHIEHLPKAINSPYDEVLPVISSDGKTLYFDRKNHPQNIRNINPQKSQSIKDNIWASTFSENGWEEAVRLPPPLNNAHHNYVCSVSADGNSLLLGNTYLPNGSVSGGISISRKTAAGWSFPEKVHIQDYENLNDYSEFSLSSNGKILLLAIETKKSFGDRDIYVSFKQASGSWSKPKNLGENINTAATELTPFLAADGRTLYFSSLGYSGYGSADMYVSRRLDESWVRWSEPKNLGKPFNSPDWDASYTLDAAGNYAYFVSYKNTNNQSADIFRAKLPQKARPEPVALVFGTIRNSETKEIIEAEIIYQNIKTGEEVGQVFSDAAAGNYKIILPLKEKYNFSAKAKRFLPFMGQIDLQTESQYVELRRDLYLTPLKVGASVRLNNVFFANSKPDLLPESYPELDRIAQAFADNPALEVRLEGHTDIAGNPLLNMKLSKARVRVVKAYLVEKGVSPNRIVLEAFGASRPLSQKRDPESMKKNRRVEFKITKIDPEK